MRQTRIVEEATYDLEDPARLSEAVVTAVADTADTDPTDLPPIFGVVDPDALDSLFGSVAGDGAPSGARIEFDYYGYSVRVEADEIAVTEA